ncbi:MAG: hypothetical protein DM484_04760 [Candidatus Methylumidiphilus alinenensis]|uniref:Uncharacterized protein n=1 Tax=Candidatus Methylumidiphilus alinenensis TaxID=2202197 RepID=A0A2W4RUR4_9GAMM|nr:MAG: hypothetical protein DM484_04760 [Candidatus Methylumidiphilus alinenensis]
MDSARRYHGVGTQQNGSNLGAGRDLQSRSQGFVFGRTWLIYKKRKRRDCKSRRANFHTPARFATG